MTIFKVPWIPRYVTEVDARLILAASVRQTPDRVWRWVFAPEKGTAETQSRRR